MLFVEADFDLLVSGFEPGTNSLSGLVRAELGTEDDPQYDDLDPETDPNPEVEVKCNRDPLEPEEVEVEVGVAPSEPLFIRSLGEGNR